MLAYRITEIDSRIVVGTDDEPILVCTSLEVERLGHAFEDRHRD